MFRIKAGGSLGRFKVEGKPLLNSLHPRTLSQIQKQCEIQHDRRRQNGIPTEKIDLDLHRVTQPPENINVVPPFLVVAARWVVVNPDYVRKVFVEIGIDFGLKDVLENRQLRLFLGLERFRIIQYLTIAIAENIG